MSFCGKNNTVILVYEVVYLFAITPQSSLLSVYEKRSVVLHEGLHIDDPR